MTVDTAFWNTIASLQKTNQFHQRPHLCGSRYPATEIADKTNSNSVFIGPIARCTPTMSTYLLLPPAKCNLNLAITAVSAVTYNKIISHTLPMPSFPVHFVKYSCIAGLRAGMMYYYCCPFLFYLSRRQPISWNFLINLRRVCRRLFYHWRNSYGLRCQNLCNLGHRFLFIYTTAQNKHTNHKNKNFVQHFNYFPLLAGGYFLFLLLCSYAFFPYILP